MYPMYRLIINREWNVKMHPACKFQILVSVNRYKMGRIPGEMCCQGNYLQCILRISWGSLFCQVQTFYIMSPTHNMIVSVFPFLTIESFGKNPEQDTKRIVQGFLLNLRISSVTIGNNIKINTGQVLGFILYRIYVLYCVGTYLPIYYTYKCN